jgi:hypothetical protein
MLGLNWELTSSIKIGIFLYVSKKKRYYTKMSQSYPGRFVKEYYAPLGTWLPLYQFRLVSTDLPYGRLPMHLDAHGFENTDMPVTPAQTRQREALNSKERTQRQQLCETSLPLPVCLTDLIAALSSRADAEKAVKRQRIANMSRELLPFRNTPAMDVFGDYCGFDTINYSAYEIISKGEKLVCDIRDSCNKWVVGRIEAWTPDLLAAVQFHGWGIKYCECLHLNDQFAPLGVWTATERSCSCDDDAQLGTVVRIRAVRTSKRTEEWRLGEIIEIDDMQVVVAFQNNGTGKRDKTWVHLCDSSIRRLNGSRFCYPQHIVKRPLNKKFTFPLS